MVAFIESPRFPDEIAAWAHGGRGFKTTVVETYGGDEYRNAAWVQQRGEWEIANAWRVTSEKVATYNAGILLNFLRVTRGMLGAFRFKDFTDYTESMCSGSGVFTLLTATTFQLYKRYTLAGQTYDQIVQKPVSGTVVVTGGTTPSVNYTTGIVSVASGTPTSWTGQFDIPVRFAEDAPKIGLDEGSGALYNWQSLRLIEVRNP